MLLDSRWAWLSNTNYPELGSPGTDLTQSKLNLEKFWGTEVRVFAFDSETGGGGNLFIPEYAHRARNFFYSADTRGAVFILTDISPPIQQSLAMQLLDAAVSSVEDFKRLCSTISFGFTAAVFGLRPDDATFFVRDRAGVLPVFWRQPGDGSSFSAGHDPRAIEAIAGRAAINHDFFAKYIYLRYDFTVGIPETHLRDTYLLQPATVLCLQGDTAAEISYWSFDDLPIRDNVDDAEVLATTRALLEESIRMSLNSSVVGSNPILALSGGLDSGIIAAYSRELNLPVRTMTAIYDIEHRVNESTKAQAVANHFNLSWEPVTITSKDFLQGWKDAYSLHASPIATSSVLGYDFLYKRVSESNSSGLVLGSRSDSFFGGDYAHFRFFLADLLAKKSHEYEPELNAWISNHSTEVFPKSAAEFLDWCTRRIDFGAPGAQIRSDFSPLDLTVASWPKVADLLRAPASLMCSSSSYLRAHTAHQVWRFGHHSTLPRLTWGWRHSLPITDGFASNSLFEWVFSLPGSRKISGGRNKILLRQIAQELLLPWQTRGVSKTGFDVPFNEWMVLPEYLDFFNDVLKSESATWLEQFVNLKEFLRCAESPQRLGGISPMFVWQLVNSELYVRSRGQGLDPV